MLYPTGSFRLVGLSADSVVSSPKFSTWSAILIVKPCFSFAHHPANFCKTVKRVDDWFHSRPPSFPYPNHRQGFRAWLKIPRQLTGEFHSAKYPALPRIPEREQPGFEENSQSKSFAFASPFPFNLKLKNKQKTSYPNQ
jgi:hypothetical protein